MKYILIALLFPAIVFAQKDSTKQHKQKGYVTGGFFAPFYDDGISLGAEVATSAMVFKGLGIGAGFQAFKFQDADKYYIPAYLSIRFHSVSSKNFTVYVEADPGYGIYDESYSNNQGLSIQTDGGFFFSAGLGFNYNTNRKVGPYISCRYARYNFKTTTKTRYETSELKNGVDAFVLGIGVWFK